MAHQQQIDFCKSVRQALPHLFVGRLVLDIGSLDINGNNQYLFDECMYIGVDLLPGRNVDIACLGHQLNLPDRSIDVIISTECFEHDQYYEKTLQNIVRMLKPGGLLLFSCASTDRPEHGTRRTRPQDAPLTQEFAEWGDYYKNLIEEDVRLAIDIDAIFGRFAFSTNVEAHDLYFWGIKDGELVGREDYSFQIGHHGLSVVLEAREEFVKELLDYVAERNEQIANLDYVVAERDGQIARLNRAIAERDRQIAKLHQAVADRG
jgi:SAM-dependent methyltransferase